jgi:hypothetical protein
MDYIQQMQRTASLSAQAQSFSQPQRPAQTATPVFTTQQSAGLSQSSSLNSELNELRELVLNQKNQFERFHQISKNKIDSLEKEVAELKEQFSKARVTMDRMTDREVVERTREAVLNRKEKAPSEKPIDRNGVAPSSVQIDKIFNCSGKKF